MLKFCLGGTGGGYTLAHPRRDGKMIGFRMDNASQIPAKEGYSCRYNNPPIGLQIYVHPSYLIVERGAVKVKLLMKSYIKG